MGVVKLHSHTKLKAVSRCVVLLDAETTQLTDHARRPEGPPEIDVGLESTAAEAAVRTSLVAALDLPGQVLHLPLCLHWGTFTR